MARAANRLITQLATVEPADLFGRLRSGRFTYCAAVSFEARSIHSISSLRNMGLTPRSAILFDYDTKAEPEDVDSEIRANHRRFILDSLAGSRLKELSRVNAYSTAILRKLSEFALSEGSGWPILIDITCMTRVHLFALAGTLAAGLARAEDVFFCYTSPDSYGLHKGDRPGWRDTILVPIGRQRYFRREGHSRGVVLAGHDGERLSLALQELEPGSGCFIYSSTPGRPDLMQRAKEANAHVSDRLLSLRMPRWSEPLGGAQDGWVEAAVGLSDFQSLSIRLLDQVEQAERDKGPIVLFPFGPKTLSFSAALFLSALDTVDPWALYPIPDRYILNYTQGAALLRVMNMQTSRIG